MPLVACPACRSSDDLVGVDDGDGRMVACSACGHRWTRELTPTCGLCGSTDLELVPTSTLEEAGRGNQRTPSGIRDAYRCWGCGARDATSWKPLPPEPDWRANRSRPAGAVPRRAPRADDTARASDVVQSAFGTFEVGAVVGGRWRIERLVRRSSTGTLWHAGATNGPQRVGFKLLHPRTPDAPEHASSARAVVGVEHPSLLRVADVQRLRDDVLIVLAAVRAPTLADARDLPPADLLAMGAGVAGALAVLHGQALAHLDVRPQAILATAPGEARLVDLGAGRARVRTGRDPRAEARMAWLAPERIVAGDHGPAADVYGLGLALWVAGGGRLADLGASPAAQTQHRLASDLPALPATTDAGRRLAEAVAAATRRRPADRPTAEELAVLLT
ncbi:MAG: protein kinase [Actinobacteria bacterium]|nr:protein kinase [Actinomycetota bacterium]